MERPQVLAVLTPPTHKEDDHEIHFHSCCCNRVAGLLLAGHRSDWTGGRSRWRTERRHPSYRYDRELRVGAVLPDSGVTYYEVPREYGSTAYRYTVVNDRTVLVDPGTHRIVEVID
jgi:hypothetical protein